MTAPKSKITTANIREIVAFRDALSEARKGARAAEARLEDAETRLMTMLRDGAVVDSKTFTAQIVMEAGACRPAWKDEYLSHMLSEHQIAEKQAEEDARGRYPAQPHEVLAIGKRT